MRCGVYKLRGLHRIKVKGEKHECSSGGKPLSIWVELEGKRPVSKMCIDCYEKIFGGCPLPSTYTGKDFGRLDFNRKKQKRTTNIYTMAETSSR